MRTDINRNLDDSVIKIASNIPIKALLIIVTEFVIIKGTIILFLSDPLKYLIKTSFFRLLTSNMVYKNIMKNTKVQAEIIINIASF
ncbi:hypothetical protein APP_12400 [Aeribacillus pallidus]|nr:hypothetical protein APP_12400 [Aeribacillus pallidus]